MEIDKVRSLLDRLPARSDYEFKYFELERHCSWHRQVRYVLLQKESLTDEAEVLKGELVLASLVDKSTKNKDELAARQRIANAKCNQLKRRIAELQQQIKQCDDWLKTFNEDELEDVISGFEKSEGEGWSEQLGREIGVQLLTEKRAQSSIMHKLALLPLSDYKKGVMITNQFANFLRKTAEQVEAAMAPNVPPTMPTTTPPPPPPAPEPAAAPPPSEAPIAAEVQDPDKPKKKKKKKKKDR